MIIKGIGGAGGTADQPDPANHTKPGQGIARDPRGTPTRGTSGSTMDVITLPGLPSGWHGSPRNPQRRVPGNNVGLALTSAFGLEMMIPRFGSNQRGCEHADLRVVDPLDRPRHQELQGQHEPRGGFHQARRERRWQDSGTAVDSGG